MIDRCIHYVGFRTDAEYSSAVKVWGRPDFIHSIHDARMYGDVGPDDIIVIGSKGTEQVSEYVDQDHMRF